MHLSAHRAQALVALKGFVSVSLAGSQRFQLVHLLFVLFRTGKELHDA